MNPHPDPTPRQREILRSIIDFMSMHGCAPTIRELSAAFGIHSPNGMMCHLKALRRKGYVQPAAAGRNSGARRIAVVGMRMVPTPDDGEAGRRLMEALHGEESRAA